MKLTRLDEPAEYATRRAELREAEVELMRQRAKVPALRRQLPPGAVVIDLLSPLWHLLTPQGRGQWYADLDY